MFAAVGTESHRYELEMNEPIVCACVCVCVRAWYACVGTVEMKNDAMKNDAKYERAAPTLCVIM